MSDEVTELLRRGGFNIRKWTSNHQHALDSLYQKDLDLVVSDEAVGTRKALWISWNAQSDELIYTVKPVDDRKKITNIPSCRKFSTLSLWGPVVLYLKVMIQECWKSKVGWDENVPQVLHTKWQYIASQLPLIRNLKISRYLLLPNHVETQINGFCDASQLGYGACSVKGCRGPGIGTVSVCEITSCSRQTINDLSNGIVRRRSFKRLFSEAYGAFKLPIQKVTFWMN